MALSDSVFPGYSFCLHVLSTHYSYFLDLVRMASDKYNSHCIPAHLFLLEPTFNIILMAIMSDRISCFSIPTVIDLDSP